jgi:hypothetical protein
MDILSKNKRFIKEKPGEKFKRILFLMPFIVGLIVPGIIMKISRDAKTKFFASTVIYSFITISIFLVALVLVFMKSDKDEKLFKIIRGRILGAAFLGVSVFLSMQVLNYYKDIPLILSSHYSYFDGNLTKVHFNNRGGYSTNLSFGNKEFKIDYKLSPQFTVIGKKYYIEFLPHSKFVMSLKIV